MVTKLFKIEEIGELLSEIGYHGCAGCSPSYEEVNPHLRNVEFEDSCDDDSDATSTFTLTFMDPQDDRFYQAKCRYNKGSNDGEWYDIVDENGKIIDPYIVPARSVGDVWQGCYRGYLDTDRIQCTQVEHKEIKIMRWVEV